MKITVFCKPNAKIPKIEKVDEVTYRVAVKAAAEEGEANQAVCEAIGKHFQVGVGQVKILAGQKSRTKIVAIKEA